MSTALVPQGTNLSAALPQEKIDLIKRTIMPRDATNDELSLFLHVCQRSGLDPLAKQIYAMKTQGKLTMITSIDGYRLIAKRTGDYAGQDGPYWCGDDGVWKDVWLPQAPPAACKVGVYIKGVERPVWGIATWASYGKQNPVWKQYPDTMLAKVAESLALGKAFPQDMSGVHIREEMRTDPRPTLPASPGQVYSGGQKQKESLASLLFDMEITDIDTERFEELSKALIGTPVSEIRAKVEQLLLGVVDAKTVSVPT